MRKVLVVDDEKLIRLGVKAMIEKKQEDFYDVTLCSNGKEAMEFVSKERFDIVVTDVRMPHMDGITFIQNLKSFEFKPAILILSGYDDFNYAVQALKCGAKDYILKPVKRETLYESLDKVEREIQLSKTLTDKEELISGYIEDFRANELNYILIKSDIAEEEIENIGKRLKLDVFDDKYYFGIIIENKNRDIKSSLKEEIHSFIEDFLKKNEGKKIVIFAMEFGLAIIANDYQLFHQLQEKYLKNIFLKFYAGISEELNGIKELKKGYYNAHEALKYRIFSQYYGTTLIKYSDISTKNRDFAVPVDKIDILRNLIETDRQGEMEKVLSELLNEARIRGFHISYLEKLNKSINSVVLEELKDKLFSKDENMIEKFQKFKDIYNFSSFKEYSHELKEFILYINEYIKTIKDIYVDRRNIDKALEYINENYYKDLNLAMVSNEVSLNYSYFSQVFKEYTGENFVNYLKKIRINMAKKLLKESDYKIYEVAEKVGYKDSKQFAKVFRNITGVSPAEYRESSFIKKD